jgi:two-component system sensor kinase FixL
MEGAPSRRILNGEHGEMSLSRVREALDLAAKEAMRARQIIRRIRSFVARGEADKRIECPVKLIEETNEPILISAKHKRVTIHFCPQADLPHVMVDRIQIQQVLFNLMRNAIEAMEKSETRLLTVAACPVGIKRWK